VAEAYRVKWPEFRNKLEGTGPFGVIHEVPNGRPMPTEDVSAELLGITYSYVLARAALGRRELRVMDWGGALGHYAAIARTSLPNLELDYHVKELPEICRVGRELFPEVVFHETDACLEAEYDVVFASGVLDSIGPWRHQLARFADAAIGYVYLTRVPIALRAPSFVCAQRAKAYGYQGTIPFWVISRAELLAEGRSRGLTLAREFLTGEREAEIPHAPERPFQSRGFLFAKQTAADVA
jgi:putative methyltransferase (TIGR04325 family)